MPGGLFEEDFFRCPRGRGMRRQSPLNMFTPDDSIQRPGCSPRSDVLVSGHGQPRRFGRRRTYSFILHISIVTAITGCWLPMLNSGIRSPHSDVSRVQHRNRPRSNSTLRPSRLPQVVPRAIAPPRAGLPSSARIYDVLPLVCLWAPRAAWSGIFEFDQSMPD